MPSHDQVLSTASTTTPPEPGPAAVLLLDLTDGTVAYANPAGHDLMGDVDLPLKATSWLDAVGLTDADGRPFARDASPVERIAAGESVRDEVVRLDDELLGVTGHRLPQDREGRPTALVVFAPLGRDLPRGMRERAMIAAGWSLTISDPHQADHPLVWVNPAFESVTGYAAQEAVGRNCRFLQGPDTDPAAVSRVRDGIAAREHRVTTLLNYRKDGTTFYNQVAISPVFDAAGALTHFVGVQADVTERVEADRARRAHLAAEQHARAAAEAAGERLSLLADAAELLADAGDADTALRRIADLVVPRLADWCMVELAEDGEHQRRLTVRHRDPDRAAAAAELLELGPRALSPNAQTAQVLRGGPPRRLTAIDQEYLLGIARGDRRIAEIYHQLGVTTALIVPLGVRGHVLGALVLARSSSDRPYEDDDLDTAADLARRAALAVDNARLRATQRNAALELQTGLLPEPQPIAGLTSAARYLPGSDGVRIGGDWFDLFALPDGAAALSVGDVVGHDMRAAASMSQMRAALRAYAWIDDDPGRVLARLDELATELEIAELATAVYGRLDLGAVVTGGAAQLDYSVAGHPPPLLLKLDGAVERLAEGHAPVLGLGMADTRPHARAAIPAGSTVVLYTDGLVEVPGASIAAGIDDVAATLANAAGAGPDELCDLLLDELDGRPTPDDIAILVVRVDDR